MKQLRGLFFVTPRNLDLYFFTQFAFEHYQSVCFHTVTYSSVVYVTKYQSVFLYLQRNDFLGQ